MIKEKKEGWEKKGKKKKKTNKKVERLEEEG